jgi:predicted homoserine dehydrogenase-like protein
MELLAHLQRREEEGQRILAGLVGCGQMGSGMIRVTERMPGLRIRAVADLEVERPLAALREMGVEDSDVCRTGKKSEAEDALAAGRWVVTDDAVLLAQLENLDAVVEATGSTEVGAKVAWACVLHGQNVVLLNVETDVTVGLLMHHLAERAGCVYTVASGDEPGVIKGLYDFGVTLGFEVVCLGKGKNNRIDFHATPESCREEAERKGMNPKMLAAFKDGTKTMVEMAAVANATGLQPDVPGMHGARVDVAELHRRFIPKADGGILGGRGRVDFSTGNVAPGVFAIVASGDARIRTDLEFMSMGPGPYYLLYRPYHLCNIETPISVAEAVIYGESTLVPRAIHAEVVAVAKRDLRAGEKVAGIGSADLYHRIYTAEEARGLGAVPMGLAAGGTVLKNVARDEVLTEATLKVDTGTTAYRLRRMQDTLVESGVVS